MRMIGLGVMSRKVFSFHVPVANFVINIRSYSNEYKKIQRSGLRVQLIPLSTVAGVGGKVVDTNKYEAQCLGCVVSFGMFVVLVGVGAVVGFGVGIMLL
jgi:hypothetical protein